MCNVRCLRRGNLDIFEFEVIDKEDSFGVPRMSVTLFNRKFSRRKNNPRDSRRIIRQSGDIRQQDIDEIP